MSWEDQCIICLNNLDHEKELICGLQCSCDYIKSDKKYHKECILEWLRRSHNSSCPCCRDPARIRYLQVICAYYYPESNSDQILMYDFETLVEFNKNVKMEIKFTPLSECIVKSS